MMETNRHLKLKKAIEQIENSPFWVDYSRDAYISDIITGFHYLPVYGLSDESNPYYALALYISHDVNELLSYEKQRNYRDSELLFDRKTDREYIIKVLKSYLDILKCLAYNKEYNKNTVLYGYNLFHICLERLRTMYDEETGKFYVIRLISEKMLLYIIDCRIQKYSGNPDRQQFYIDAREEIQNGDKLIKKCWLIDD